MIWLGSKREETVMNCFSKEEIERMVEELKEKCSYTMRIKIEEEIFTVKIYNENHFSHWEYKFMLINEETKEVMELHSTSLMFLLERFIIDILEMEVDYEVEPVHWSHYVKRRRIY